MTELTTAAKRVLLHQFGEEVCPVCHKWKQRRWCFCRSCYFALKQADPQLASGLYVEAFNGTDEFFENYAKAKEWLQRRGLGDQGGLFA
jgi:hypothetical protein